MLDLFEGIAELFLDAQDIVIGRAIANHARRAARERRTLDQREYYQFVRLAPAWREKENSQARKKRQAARLARAAERPPCPNCGGEVTRGATVTRGRKLAKYCSAKCMRSAVQKRWVARQHPLWRHS